MIGADTSGQSEGIFEEELRGVVREELESAMGLSLIHI